MNKKEFDMLSKFLSPEIATKARELEEAIDNYCVKIKGFKRSEYKIGKEAGLLVLLEMIPDFVRRVNSRIVSLSFNTPKNKKKQKVKY